MLGVTAQNRGVKRKRESVESGNHSEKDEIIHAHLFKNWVPPGWDKEKRFPRQTRTELRQLDTPIFKEDEDRLEDWAGDLIKGMEVNGVYNKEASVETTTDVIVKVREVRSDSGYAIERQQVERKLEVFRWLKNSDTEGTSNEKKSNVLSPHRDVSMDGVKTENNADLDNKA